jgi:hypothetical protein
MSGTGQVDRSALARTRPATARRTRVVAAPAGAGRTPPALTDEVA